MYTPRHVERYAAACYEEGQYVAAEMLRAYAATLKAAQGGVTEAMVERALEAFCTYRCNTDDAEGMMRAALEAALSAEPAERVPDGLKLAIAHIQQKADVYAEENCGVEWDTGATVYRYGQAGEDYHHGLLELVDELTQLAASPAPSEGGKGVEG